MKPCPVFPKSLNMCGLRGGSLPPYQPHYNCSNYGLKAVDCLSVEKMLKKKKKITHSGVSRWQAEQTLQVPLSPPKIPLIYSGLTFEAISSRHVYLSFFSFFE